VSNERIDHTTFPSGLAARRIYADHLARYHFALPFVKSKTVLDIASGNGYGSGMLASFAKLVVSVDNSSVSLSSQKSNLSIVCADVYTFLLSTRRKFDVIVSFETIEHLNRPAYFVKLLYRHLLPQGRLILSTPNKEIIDYFFGSTYNKFHLKEFYTTELRALLAKHFKRKPKLYRQRPLRKKHLFFSTLTAYQSADSPIVSDRSHLSGITNIFYVYK
jgi:2-polyprenyl-3-methyl-5-hydroxy-6-metoxy-1,4-benzoquinol methylase